MTGTSTREVTLPAHWAVRRGVHGGLLAAVLLRAATDHLSQRPTSIGVHYLRPATAGPATTSVRTIRAGRSASSAQVELSQGERLATALVELTTTVDVPLLARRLPEHGVPDPGDVRAELTGLSGPSEERLEIRTIATAPDAPTPTTEAWARLAFAEDAADLGVLGAGLVLVDALTPALLAGRRRAYTASTVALTAHIAPAVRAEPDAWFHVRHRTLWSTAELCLEDTELHTRRGDLVMHARQTRRLLGNHGLT